MPTLHRQAAQLPSPEPTMPPTEEEQRQDAARRRAARIVARMADLAKEIQAAWDARDDITLGYASWSDYCMGEFGRGGVAIQARQVVVAVLRGEGLSQRAIAAETGVTPSTVHNDIADTAAAQPPGQLATVTGLDGRQHPAGAGGAPAAERNATRREAMAAAVDLEGLRGRLEGLTDSPAPASPPTSPPSPTPSPSPTHPSPPAASPSPPSSPAPAPAAGRARQNREQARQQLAAITNRVTDATAILRDITPSQYPVTELNDLAVLYDQLVTLAEWATTQATAISTKISSSHVEQRIAKLRQTRGRTTEEANTALRIADRLEAQMRGITP